MQYQALFSLFILKVKNYCRLLQIFIGALRVNICGTKISRFNKMTYWRRSMFAFPKYLYTIFPDD